MQQLSNILEKFEPISLSEMDAVELLNRTDTKYVFHSSMLPLILESLRNDYFILEVNGLRTCRYESLYYDNKNLECYLNHHNGKANRVKVRYRKYESSGVSFFEIKNKTNTDRTYKKRMKCSGLSLEMSETEQQFFEKYTSFKAADFLPSVQTDFTRITLVKKDMTERATFDYKLAFSCRDSVKTIDAAVIAEVKQSRFNYQSPIIKHLKSKHLAPRSVSKYCWGVVETHDHIKKNTFKLQLHEINKMLLKTQTNGTMG